MCAALVALERIVRSRFDLLLIPGTRLSKQWLQPLASLHNVVFTLNKIAEFIGQPSMWAKSEAKCALENIVGQPELQKLNMLKSELRTRIISITYVSGCDSGTYVVRAVCDGCRYGPHAILQKNFV
jgi:hypothetical protein